MSRLYAWVTSDTNENAKTITGHEFIHIKVNWGNRGDSKHAASLEVSWIEGEDQPTVRMVNEVEN